MKYVISFFKWLLILILLIILGLLISGNRFLIKGVWATYLHGYKSASIEDSRFFSTRTIEAGEAIPWEIATNYNKLELSPALIQSLEEYGSIAFIIIKNDEILYEQYWDGFGEASLSNSFSMAKSITTMLAQCAIQDGYITSWDQKAKDFLPGLKGDFADELTLRNLSTMTAGLDFNEHYTNPFDITARLYYGPDASKLMLEEVPVAEKPGEFEYQSGATQLLGMAIVNATGKSLAEYASEKFWKPMGANHDAMWHLDNEDGIELSFCCFNSNARDFARFGKMLINEGNFEGIQILDSSFVKTASQPYAVPYYGHGFWRTDKYNTPIFYQRGILGQYVIVIPERDIVIVRLGHKRGDKVDAHTVDFHTMVSEVLQLVP